MKNVLRLVCALFCAGLLLLPSFVAAKDEAPKVSESVMKIIKSRNDLSKFAGMISDAGLDGVLAGKEGVYTVFAPTNDALSKVPSDVMKRVKADKDRYKKFVGYHIISGSRVFYTNIKGRRAGPAAMSGETLAFEGAGQVVKVNDAAFVTSDLTAANGVVHVVDAAMIPPSFREQPVRLPEPAMPKEIGPDSVNPPAAKAAPAVKNSPAAKAAPVKANDGTAGASSEEASEQAKDGKASDGVEEGEAVTVPPEVTPAVPVAPVETVKKKSWLQKLMGQ